MSTYHSKFIRKHRASPTLILWIPGANDTFFHQEQLDQGLFKQYDIYLLHPGDYHPCDLEDETDPPGHSTENFYLYFSQIDSELELLMSDHHYTEFIMYSHSTGSLLALEYARYGTFKNKITKIIFDDPFWDYNQSNSIIKLLMHNTTLYPLTWKLKFPFVVFNKNKVLSYNTKSKTKVHQRQKGYKVPFTYENNDYAAFPVACSRTMKMIQNTKDYVLEIPVLILIAKGNRMLNETRLTYYSKFISRINELEIIDNCYHTCLMPDNKSNLKSVIDRINQFIDSKHNNNNNNRIHELNEKTITIEQYHNKILLLPTIFMYSMIGIASYCLGNYIIFPYFSNQCTSHSDPQSC